MKSGRPRLGLPAGSHGTSSTGTIARAARRTTQRTATRIRTMTPGGKRRTSRIHKLTAAIGKHRTAIVIGGCAAAAIGAACALPATRRAARSATERIRSSIAYRIGRRHGVTQIRFTASGLDELTGLPNDFEAERLLAAALDRAAARNHRVAVLRLDIDEFDSCNETYGQDAGDHVLQVCAARMQAQLRTGDAVCRVGSDDFVVIMEPAGPDHMLNRIGERIVDALSEPISFDGETMLIGSSVGVAVAPRGDGTPEQLLKQADIALGLARANGRKVMQSS